VVAVRTFDTDDFAKSDRLAAWSDFTSSSLFGAEYSVYTSDGLRAHQRYLALGEVGLFSFATNAHAVERTASLVDLQPKQAVMISLVLEGQAMYYSADQMCIAGPGDLLIYPADRPYLMAFHQSTSQLLLDFPMAYFDVKGLSLGVSSCLKIDRLAQATARTGSSELSMLRALIASGQGDVRMATEWVSAWIARLDARVWRHAPSGHVSAATKYVDRHFGDPTLDIATVAAAVGVSPRHLSREFQALGRTPMQYLVQTRIESARRLITDTDSSMTEIASACGFGSPSHFSRAFHGAVGLAPRAYRHQFALARVNSSRP
jgi:AraC-like DNA-binding protein